MIAGWKAVDFRPYLGHAFRVSFLQEFD